jgi:hypothetical protein
LVRPVYQNPVSDLEEKGEFAEEAGGEVVAEATVVRVWETVLDAIILVSGGRAGGVDYERGCFGFGNELLGLVLVKDGKW